MNKVQHAVKLLYFLIFYLQFIILYYQNVGVLFEPPHFQSCLQVVVFAHSVSLNYVNFRS